MKEPLALTDLQLAVLRVIWDRGGATVPEVTRALYRKRHLAQSTVATVMGRLEKRGVLLREGEPREYVYRSRFTEAQVRREMVRDLTSLLFKGEPAALVSHLVESSQLDEDDLKYALELLRAAEKEKDR